MKNFLSLMIVAVAMIVISGCSSKMVKVEGVNPDKVTIWDNGKQKFTFNPKRDYWNASQGTKRDKYFYGVKMALNAASIYGLQSGYTHLAIVNNGINNLSGFPINDWATLSKYGKLEDRANTHFKVKTEGSEGKYFLIKNGVTLEVVFLKNKVPGLFLWDLQKLRRDTL